MSIHRAPSIPETFSVLQTEGFAEVHVSGGFAESRQCESTLTPTDDTGWEERSLVQKSTDEECSGHAVVLTYPCERQNSSCESFEKAIAKDITNTWQ